jgi:FkbM family methyltransferase
MPKELLFALTSLSPSQDRVAPQKTSIRSWRDAGMQVWSFNHPSEIAKVAKLYDVNFCPVTKTSITTFGGHYIPISAMLDWARERDAPVLILNSDIELQLSPWELKRMRWLSAGGLCYFVRYNHDGDRAYASREPYGIDAFLLHGRDCRLFSESSLCMGQPFWDYWLPYTMAVHGRPIFSVEFPAAFHRNHPRQWSWENYVRCAQEFDRLTGALGTRQAVDACTAMSKEARELFDREGVKLQLRPAEIRHWVEATFQKSECDKTFIELGAHCGTDTEWMARLPGVRLHSFEPDPRNNPPQFPNVVLHRAAISDRDGVSPFVLSKQGWGREWTHSSSLKAPRNHLTRYPVTFGESIEVRTRTLDSLWTEQGLSTIDFIWADIQGAEAEMIRGGRQALEHTRYLFTEYSDDELYENQATLGEIVEMLPGFRVVELWPDDVLLENQRFRSRVA